MRSKKEKGSKENRKEKVRLIEKAVKDCGYKTEKKG